MGYPQHHNHLLLIEDNEGDILLTMEALESRNSSRKIHVCKDGLDAIRFLESCLISNVQLLPSMILLDINLPKKNGQEVLKFIKENQSLEHIQVIMLTTSSSESDVAMAQSHRADGYLTKPVDSHGFEAIADQIELYWNNLTPTKY
jgi:CheY-like chemotaxis protein